MDPPVVLAVDGVRLIVQPHVFDASARLIDVLRNGTRSKGPKIGCGEGGCGACSVLVHRLDPVTGTVHTSIVNSCLATIGSYDGVLITTSEGLGNSKCGFHPVQEAIAKRFASQCGFCTPGIVVAMAAAAEQGPKLLVPAAAAGSTLGITAAVDGSAARAVAIARGLEGNLCRCTGWRPIIDACKEIADVEELQQCRQSCQQGSSSCKSQSGCSGSGSFHCASHRNDGSCPGRSCSIKQRSCFPTWLEEYVLARHNQHQQESSVQHAVPDAMSPFNGCYLDNSTAAGQLWLRPKTLQQLAFLLQASRRKPPRLVAGNTAAGVYKELWPYDARVVDLTGLAELKTVVYHKQGVLLGAGLTIQELLHILKSPAAQARQCQHDNQQASNNSHISMGRSSGSSSQDQRFNAGAGCDVQAQSAPACTKGVWGAMAAHVERIAGVQVRSLATLGGHFGLCAIKPLQSDLAPLLAAAGAQLQIMALPAAPNNARPIASPMPWDQGHTQDSQWQQSQWQQQQQWHHGDHNVPLGQTGQHACAGFGTWHSRQQQLADATFCWVSVEEYLAGSCIGTSSCSSNEANVTTGSSSTDYITAECIAGAKITVPQGHDNILAATAATAAAADNSNSPATGTDSHQVITAVWVPYGNDECEAFWSDKVALRYVNSHALINAAMYVTFDQSTVKPGAQQAQHASHVQTACSTASCSHVNSGGCSSDSSTTSRFTGAKVVSARAFVGYPPSLPSALQPAGGGHSSCGHFFGSSCSGIGSCSGSSSCAVGDGAVFKWEQEHWRLLRASHLEAELTNRPLTVKGLVSSMRQLERQLADNGLPLSSFHAQALQGILFKALAPLVDLNPTVTKPSQQLLRLLQLPDSYNPNKLPAGRQVLPAGPKNTNKDAPVHLPVEKDAVRLQASGEAVFAADVAAGLAGSVLYLAGIHSSEALALVDGVDATQALAAPGVVGCITAADIPGINTVMKAPLLADGKVEYVGQLIGLIAATSQTAADRAATLVIVKYKQHPSRTPIITIDQAIASDSFYEIDSPLLAAVGVKRQSEHNISQTSWQRVTLPSRADCVSNDSTTAWHHANRPNAEIDDIDKIIAAAPLQIKGATYRLPSQQHMYMETQTAVAEPQEDGCLKVTSATQSLDAVQQAVAAVLRLPFHKITVVAKRVGGGFGGKASRPMPVAAAAALAAAHFGAPVCYSLNRNVDLAVNYGRSPGLVEYDVGFDDQGKVHAVKAQVMLRAGAYLDLAANDAAGMVASSECAYDMSGFAISVKLARCNLPPHTIVRGPGTLQGVMFIEQVMEHAAAVLGRDAATVKAANFLPAITTNITPCSMYTMHGSVGRLCLGSESALSRQHQQPPQQQTVPLENDGIASVPATAAQQLAVFADDRVARAANSSSIANATATVTAADGEQQKAAAGVRTVLGRFIAAEDYTLPQLWAELLDKSDYNTRLGAVQQYNRDHAWSKRGIAVTPVRFECSPAAVSAALSVYYDGSVLVTHGGIEMGQGLSTKVQQAAVAALSRLLPEDQRPLPLSAVRLAASSSDIVPNNGPTWSSTGSEGCCQAVMVAAAKLVAQLAPHLRVGGDGWATWQATIAAVHPDLGFQPATVMLSAYGSFDGTLGNTADKQPVHYSAFGAAVSEVELDVLTGERRVLATHIMYDCGYSLNPAIDLGQVEGAFVMGLGVVLSEEVTVDDTTGQHLSNSTWTYKIPTPDLIPQQFSVSFLANAPNRTGIMSSKASGEPALMNATSVLMALQQAAAAAVEEVQGLADGSFCGAVVNKGASDEHWRVLPAPATPQRLKGIIGQFSIADALEAALKGPL